MRTLVAAAFLAYANADETSLMQDLVKRSTSTQLSASDGKTSRHDSTSKLLETAVKMIKNGVTPDVITFVDSTNQEINEQVLVAIQNEHDTDQAYIDDLCQQIQSAINTLAGHFQNIDALQSASETARNVHHDRRVDEAVACASSRKCEEELRVLWIEVERQEAIMIEIHDEIHDEWCIHPPFFAEIEVWLQHPFNWAKTSPYPELNIPDEVATFRHVSKTLFERYITQKVIVEQAWTAYNEKLSICYTLEIAFDSAVEAADTAQRLAEPAACKHAEDTRTARKTFGDDWHRLRGLYDAAREAKSANEADRKAEWETLKIVQCLLDHVHSTVTESIETGAPCPTIDSDPDGVTLAIEDCHIVTRGCDEASLTGHLCLNWCEFPEQPPQPPVVEPACTPAYIAWQQGSFYGAAQSALEARLVEQGLTGFSTDLSDAGWAGCAPPLVCVDCAGVVMTPPLDSYTDDSHSCKAHELYLAPGESNFDSFRCLDGNCISMSGRCNGHGNCLDSSDELGCDENADIFVPAYVATSKECPAAFSTDVHFQCANLKCIEKVGLCNGHDNCGDNSDEEFCSTVLVSDPAKTTIEALSGKTATVELMQSHWITTFSVFHDRASMGEPNRAQYHFDNIGDFAGKTFVKYSNDDKTTVHEKVMTKIRTTVPTTVYIVKQPSNSLPWLVQEGFEPSSLAGVAFSGQRQTVHKDWNPKLLETDHFDASEVFTKTYAAGTIILPGNGEGDGSFLIFMDKALP